MNLLKSHIPEPPIWTGNLVHYRGKYLMTFANNYDVTRLASILTNLAHIPLAYGLLLGQAYHAFITEVNGAKKARKHQTMIMHFAHVLTHQNQMDSQNSLKN